VVVAARAILYRRDERRTAQGSHRTLTRT